MWVYCQVNPLPLATVFWFYYIDLSSAVSFEQSLVIGRQDPSFWVETVILFIGEGTFGKCERRILRLLAILFLRVIWVTSGMWLILVSGC